MITTKLYFDKRFTKGDEAKQAPIKIVITRKGTTALIGTDIKVFPNQWDAKKQIVVNHENAKRINLYISKFKVRIETIIMEIEESGQVYGMNASKVKDHIMSILNPQEEENDGTLFVRRYMQFAERKNAKTSRRIYLNTLAKIRQFDRNIDKLHFEDIDRRWLMDFDYFLEHTLKNVANTRAICFHNICAVFNDAINDEVTTCYPFRKFKIKTEPTKKRSLTIEQLRNLFNAKVRESYQEYIDVFKLLFFLCGINIVDLFKLTNDSLVNGRIEYKRSKTGRKYSIKVEPEAMEIINKYRGEKHLLIMSDEHDVYKYYTTVLNHALKRIGNEIGRTKNNESIMDAVEPKISSYWARHTWATIAAELDIPKETIAAGLGHSIGSPITSIYIDFNLKKVDEANRKIIDYVLYNKV